MGSTPVEHSVLNVKAVVAAFNQEKALVGAFSVITNLQMDLFQALLCSVYTSTPGCMRPTALHGYFPSDAIKTVPAAAILLLPPWAEQPPHYTLGASAAHILWIYCVVVDPTHQHNLGSDQYIISSENIRSNIISISSLY